MLLKSVKNITIILVLSILVFILSITVVFYSEVPRQEDICGIWKGEHHRKELLFRFNSDGTCILSFKDNISGSTRVLNGNFEVSFNKKPIPLTIRNILQLNHPLHTIIKLMGEDSIKIAHFAPLWRFRPISFDSNTSMNLRRDNEN